MEVLNLIYMALSMTALTKMTKRQKIWSIHCAVSVLIECFHLQNEILVNGVDDISQKIINWGVF